MDMRPVSRDRVLMHVRLPKELVRQLDALAQGQSRSRLVEEALRELARSRRVREAIARGRGLLANGPWRSDEGTDRWVENARREWTRP